MAVSPQLEIIFDVVKSSRKYPKLKKNPRVTWMVGRTTEVSVQYEGELGGEALSKYKKGYFATFPDGPVRESWPGITYFGVRPMWVRHCDCHPDSRRVEVQKFSSAQPCQTV
jgi:hypothetical protein